MGAETQPRELPILFNGEMVRAINEGRKTQTRRPVTYVSEDYVLSRAPYSTGDLLYVREAFRGWIEHSGEHIIQYAADQSIHTVDRPQGHPEGGMLNGRCCADRWRPSIHMPKWAARIWLRVTDVRVQRVQEISENDAKAEGADRAFALNKTVYRTYINGFSQLWDAAYGPDAWERNDWVFAYTFERVERPEALR